MDTHSDGTVSITVNGQHKRVAAGLTLAVLAAELGFAPERAAVERNLEPVPRAALRETPVEDGDDLEITGSAG